MFKLLVLASSFYGLANAECPNGCSSHGRCTAYDMCLCYRNWMSNDCSERVCQFGLAHVDTPKGDLNSDGGELSGPDTTVVVYSEMYPSGTQEQFPQMVDSSGEVLDNTAHHYMECSNKGICDREAGVCECFPGYEGSACQRASCPGGSGAEACSGHGTCQSIQEISAADNSNIYELWDKQATLGCVCDAGYYGADCALRECKYGADPLYYDDNANIRYSNWTIQFAVSGASSSHTVSGTWAIIFYDHFGEDWQTEPLHAGASCADIIDALEGIPNDVIPSGSVRCRKFTESVGGNTDNNWENIIPSAATGFEFTNKYKYTLMFPSNPGYLEEIRVNMYLDGARASLYTSESTSTLTAFVYANGFHGEDDDLVPDECENVLVTFSHTTSVTVDDDSKAGFFAVGSNVYLSDFYYLNFGSGLEPDVSIQTPLLKRCLGDADNRVNDDNMADEVYDWDYGSEQNPHLVKFIEATENIESRICHSINDIAWMDSINRGGSESMLGWCFERSPAGFYAPVIFRRKADSLSENRASKGWFVVYSQAPADYAASTQFRVFTTKGYLNRVRQDGDVFTLWSHFQDFYSNVLYSVNRGVNINAASYPSAGEGSVNADTPFRSNSAAGSNYWLGNMDCETSPSRNIFYEDCLEKGDYVMFFSVENTQNNYQANPKYHNIYQVEKIYIAYPLVDTGSNTVEEPLRSRIVLDKHVNFAWPQWQHGPIANSDTPGPLGANVAASGSYTDPSGSNHVDDVRLRAYKFYPPASTVKYVDQCSGRGLCNAAEGLCECFPGYTNDDCSVQNGGSH